MPTSLSVRSKSETFALRVDAPSHDPKSWHLTSDDHAIFMTLPRHLFPNLTPGDIAYTTLGLLTLGITEIKDEPPKIITPGLIIPGKGN